MWTSRGVSVLVLLLGVAVGCSSGGDESATTTSTTERRVPVTVKLAYDFEPFDNSGIGRDAGVGSNCGVSGLTNSTDTLAFMQPDADVLLRDAENRIVARTKLDVGETTEILPGNRFACQWSVRFSDVPASEFYEVSVGDENVGTLSEQEARQGSAPTLDLGLVR